MTAVIGRSRHVTGGTFISIGRGGILDLVRNGHVLTSASGQFIET